MLSRSLSLLILFGITIAVVSCRGQRAPATNNSPAPIEEFSSTPPFQTKEPERYAASRTITITTSAGSQVVNTYSIARDGQMRREEYDQLVFLSLPTGRFVLSKDDKTYGELTNEQGFGPNDALELESSPDRLLHTDPIKTSYQRLGSETVNGRVTTKYRVVVNAGASGTVNTIETLTWVDESIGIPVKSETVSADGRRSTIELANISLAPDKGLFQIPEGYRKVDAAEIMRRRK